MGGDEDKFFHLLVCVGKKNIVGQTWANDGQSFPTVKSIKCFHGGADENFFFGHIFFLEGGQTKIFYGQIWANDGQTNAVSFFQKFEFGGAIFTELKNYVYHLYRYQSDKFLPFCLLLNLNLYLIIINYYYLFTYICIFIATK